MDATRDDPKLLRRAVNGDRVALGEVARRWWPTIRRQALAILADRALADDAAQDTLVRLLRFIHQYDPARPFAPWLYALVRSACHGVRGRPVEALGDPAGVDRADRDLDLRAGAREALARLRELPERQREALELCDGQGLGPTEAARIMGIAPGTARALLFQARRALRARLPGDEIVALLREA